MHWTALMGRVWGRALCRIKLLPVTHVLVDTWVLTVKQVYKRVWWTEMDYKHTCDTIITHFQCITNNIYGFGIPFFAPSFFTRPQPFHHISTCPYSFLTRPNDGWTGLYIKLWLGCVTCWTECIQPWRLTLERHLVWSVTSNSHWYWEAIGT